MAATSAVVANVALGCLFWMCDPDSIAGWSAVGVWLAFPVLIASVITARTANGALLGGAIAGVATIACGWANAFGWYGIPVKDERALVVVVALLAITTGLAAGALVREVYMDLDMKRAAQSELRRRTAMWVGVRKFLAPSTVAAVIVYVFGRTYVSASPRITVTEADLNPFWPVPRIVIGIIILLLGLMMGAIVGASLRRMSFAKTPDERLTVD